MLGSSSAAAQLAASQEGLNSMSDSGVPKCRKSKGVCIVFVFLFLH
jgi:hypothetical protein